MVTWEFLEAKNTELSVKLGMPTPTITLREPPADPLSVNNIPETIGFNPKLVAVLEEDEAEFMIAHALTSRRYMDQAYPNWRTKRLNPNRIKLGAQVIRVSLFVAIVAYAILGHPDAFTWIAIAVFLPLILLMPWIAKLKCKLESKQGHHRFDFSPLFRRRFYEAANLTGKPEAGERYIRKSISLKETSRLQNMLGEDAYSLARRAYDSNVPPEFQRPNEFELTFRQI